VKIDLDEQADAETSPSLFGRMRSMSPDGRMRSTSPDQPTVTTRAVTFTVVEVEPVFGS
jgi:hypothetical protein